MIMSISGFVDTIPVSTLQSVSIIESEFVQAALTGRIPLTDPDVQISRIRFFTREIRSRRRSHGGS